MIAYHSGSLGGATLSNQNTKLFVVSTSGGSPREVQTGFSGACCPIWTPDGKLLFLGNQDGKKPLEEALDWWVVSVDGGAAIKTGVLERARAKGLCGVMAVAPAALIPRVWDPHGNRVIFSALSGDSTNLWQIEIDPRTYRSLGEPTRLTWGTSVEWKPAIAIQAGAKLRVVFASLEENTDIWGIPVFPPKGVGSQPRRLTEETSTEQHPAISPDGSRLAFLSNRTGTNQVWLKTLATGEQTQLTTTPVGKFLPLFSDDGRFLSYATTGRWDVRRLRLWDGADDLICEACGLATSWTSGGLGVLYHDVPGRVSLLDLASRRSTMLLSKEQSRLTHTQPSVDGRWILFVAFTGGLTHQFIAPYRGPSKIEERDWITINEGLSLAARVTWRADGNALYFTSDRDGFMCVWTQPLDSVSKRPSGPPVAVFHAHNAQYSMAPMFAENTITASSDLLVFTMSEHTGSIWMAEWK